MTSQEGNAERSLDESSWEGPTMKKLQEEGLGAGIDATKPGQLLRQQITPTTNNVIRNKFGAGDKMFNGAVNSESEIRHTLSSSLKSGKVAQFEIGFHFQKKKFAKQQITVEDKKSHKETVLFKDQLDDNSSIHLVELLKEAAKEKGLDYSHGERLDAITRDSICSDVIEKSGATHFISSVDLGARNNTITTVDEEENQIDGGASAQIDGLFKIMAKGGWGRSKVNRKGKTTIEEFCLGSPAEQKTIAYSVQPIWKLIKEEAWQESVKKACLEYPPPPPPRPVPVGPGPPRPVPVGPENPVLIRTASSPPRYLKVTNDESKGEAVKKVEATATKKEADGFLLEYLEDKDESDFDEKLKGKSPFSLVFKNGDKSLYFTPDKNNTIVLSNHIHEGNGMFTLAAPNHFEDRPVCDWQDGKNFFVRHNKKGMKRKRLFLSLDPPPNTTPLKMTPKKKIHRQDSQFCLETPIGTY